MWDAFCIPYGIIIPYYIITNADPKGLEVPASACPTGMWLIE